MRSGCSWPRYFSGCCLGCSTLASTASFRHASSLVPGLSKKGRKVMLEIAQKMVGLEPQELRRQLQEAHSPRLRRRRKIIGLSLFGVGVTAVISLFQTGIARHL